MGLNALCPAIKSSLGEVISINYSKDLPGSCRSASVSVVHHPSVMQRG